MVVRDALLLNHERLLAHCKRLLPDNVGTLSRLHHKRIESVSASDECQPSALAAFHMLRVWCGQDVDCTGIDARTRTAVVLHCAD